MRSAWLLLAMCGLGWCGDRIVPLFDEHAAAPLQGGWGYSALVEYRGRRILFDAGSSAEALAKNTKALGIDLGKLDAVVISHDDPDHYAGLDSVYAVNPAVKVYVPDSDSGAFSTSIFDHLFRFVHGVAEPPSRANYVRVPGNLQLWPGVRLVSLAFQGGSRREQALILDVPGGVAMLTGCAHPGVVNFVQHAGGPVRLATGGFHLMKLSEADVRQTVQAIKKAGVESVYPAHCTGRLATVELRKVFGARCNTVAVGGTIPMPSL